MIFNRAGSEFSELARYVSSVRVAVSIALKKVFSGAIRFFPSTYHGCVCNVKESTDSRLDVRKMSGYGYSSQQISASFATFEPCESHAMHREVAVTMGGLSRRHG